MEAKHIKDIQEAYASVYGQSNDVSINLTEGEEQPMGQHPGQSPSKQVRDRYETQTRRSTAPKGVGVPDKSTGYGQLQQSTDLFDLVKGHLLDEGYADTEEAALAIMANMSEEWKQDILTERLAPGTTGVSFATGRKKGTLEQGMTATNPATGRQRKTSPESKAIGAHARAKSAQWKAESEGRHDDAARHKERRDKIAHAVYTRTNRIIDRADND